MSHSALPSHVAALTRAVHSARAHLARTAGLEPGSNYVLSRLAAQGDLRSSDLAAQACVDASVVSRQVQLLLAQGFIKRVADPKDGRASLLHLTQKGATFLRQNQEIQEKFFAGVMHDWSEKEREQFSILLERFVNDFTGEIQKLNLNQEVQAVNE